MSGKVASCSSQHRCLCSAAGQEKSWSLCLGLEQLQLPYLKFGEVVEKTGALLLWSTLLGWCCVNFNKIGISIHDQSCSIQTLFIQLNSEQNWLRSGEISEADLEFYNTNTSAARLFCCKIFCLFYI